GRARHGELPGRRRLPERGRGGTGARRARPPERPVRQRADRGRFTVDPGRRVPGPRVPRARSHPGRAHHAGVGAALETGGRCEMRRRRVVSALMGLAVFGCARPQGATYPLWATYERSLAHAKYVDLTHVITPQVPVWPGFGEPTFGPTLNPATGKPYTWTAD